jgi:hypothetical protein
MPMYLVRVVNVETYCVEAKSRKAATDLIVHLEHEDGEEVADRLKGKSFVDEEVESYDAIELKED